MNPRDPQSHKSASKETGAEAQQPRLISVGVILWGNVTFRRLLLALSTLFFFSYGILQWQPTFLARSYGLKTSEIGTWLAIIYGGGGLIGAYLGGDLASRFAANRESLQLKALSIAVSISGVLSIIAYLSWNKGLSLTLIAMVVIGVSTVNGPLFAVIQTLVPERMRATSFALVYLFANLVGMGFGPLVAGALSDELRGKCGAGVTALCAGIACPRIFRLRMARLAGQ